LPYCGVGCGQLIYHKDGKLVSIEGDPESQSARGIFARKARLLINCSHTMRETKMKYRACARKNGRRFRWIAPWTWWWTGFGIAQAHLRAKERRRDDQPHNWNMHLGGATLDNEEII